MILKMKPGMILMSLMKVFQNEIGPFILLSKVKEPELLLFTLVSICLRLNMQLKIRCLKDNANIVSKIIVASVQVVLATANNTWKLVNPNMLRVQRVSRLSFFKGLLRGVV